MTDAWEHQQKLNNDPKYQAMLSAKKQEMDKKLAEIQVIEKDFLEEWHKNGFVTINNTGDLIARDFKLNQIMAKFILGWIPKMDNKHSSQEMLVRSLARPKIAIEGKVLMSLFDNPDSSFYLKWAIGNTIASAQVEGVEKWIKSKFMALTLGKENEMLVYAVAKYFENDDAVKILRSVLENYPMQVIDVLGKIGKKEDIEFLKDKVKGFKGAQKAAMVKAIKKLSEKYPE